MLPPAALQGWRPLALWLDNDAGCDHLVKHQRDVISAAFGMGGDP